VIANAVINRGGANIFVRLKEETGRGAADVAIAFTAAMAVFDLESLFDEIDALDTIVSGNAQLDLYRRVQVLLRQQTAWFLRCASFEKGLKGVIAQYREGVEALRKAFSDIATDRQHAAIDSDRKALEEKGVPGALAQSIAMLRVVSAAPEIALITEQTGKPVSDVSGTYARAADYFRIGGLKEEAEALVVSDYFDRLAIDSTISSLTTTHRGLVRAILESATGADFNAWVDANRDTAERVQRALDEVVEGGDMSLSRLTVAVGHLGDAAVT
jgi:glutamate dehydrogenase